MSCLEAEAALPGWRDSAKQKQPMLNIRYAPYADKTESDNLCHLRAQHYGQFKKEQCTLIVCQTTLWLLNSRILQKWHLQKSASDDEVKIELRPVLAQFKANLSFPTPGMLLSGL